MVWDRALKGLASRLPGTESGSSAVEFALVAPFLLMIVFGIFGAGCVLATVNGLEQLSAGAARSAVGGLSTTERDSLARTYITTNVGAYAYITPAMLQVSTSSNAATVSFTVTASYDMSTSAIYLAVKNLVSIPHPVLVRSSTIQQGGY
jgi:Flp pilus assembly protein TadG